MRIIELLTQTEESVWVIPAHIVAMENVYETSKAAHVFEFEEWIATRVTLVTGRTVDTVLPITDIVALMNATVADLKRRAR